MGQFLRPKAEVLSDDALVPDKNLISPPDHFTHQLTRAEPYYFGSAHSGRPDGEFPAGTKVLLIGDDGDRCRVADEQGLYVEIACAALTKL